MFGRTDILCRWQVDERGKQEPQSHEPDHNSWAQAMLTRLIFFLGSGLLG